MWKMPSRIPASRRKEKQTKSKKGKEPQKRQEKERKEAKKMRLKKIEEKRNGGPEATAKSVVTNPRPRRGPNKARCREFIPSLLRPRGQETACQNPRIAAQSKVVEKEEKTH
jgi:hypothetical protein